MTTLPRGTQNAVPKKAACTAAAPGTGATGDRVAGALGNHCSNFTPPVSCENGLSNTHLWQLQRTMWAITQNKRLAGCHRWLAPNAGAAFVQWRPGRATWGGLQNSRSVWGSPLAAKQIASKRGVQVGLAFGNWLERNMERRVVFATFTLAHNRNQTLRHLWDSVAKCWHGVTAGNPWVRAKSKYGIAHWVKSTEVTHGANGWHVHVHAVLLLNQPLTQSSQTALHSWLYGRWAKKAVKLGLKAPTRKHGVDIRQIGGSTTDQSAKVAAYLVKGALNGLGKEITGGANKTARKTSRTPFQILESIGHTTKGTKEYKRLVKLWHTWEDVSNGRRQIAWSRGSKEALGVANLSDAELVALSEAEERQDAYSVAQIPREAWLSKSADGVVVASNIELRQHVLEYVRKATSAQDAKSRADYALQQFGVAHTSQLAALTQEEYPPVARVTPGSKLANPPARPPARPPERLPNKQLALAL